MNLHDLEFQDLRFQVFSHGEILVKGSLRRGEAVALQGPSGCGKTTFLRVLAGLQPTTSGKVMKGGQDITQLKPHLRRVGFVFQGSPLFEHLNVLENLCFGMRNFFPAYSEELLRSRASEFLEKVALAGYESRSTLELSGGERSRVAIARTLLCEPDFLLLDEPFSALDENLKQEVMSLLRSLLDKNPIPSLLVTHSKLEAESFSSRILEWSENQRCLNFT